MVRRMDLEGGVGNFRREFILNKEEQIAFILYFLIPPPNPLPHGRERENTISKTGVREGKGRKGKRRRRK